MGWGILRSPNRELIFAYTVPLRGGTNNQEEVEAIVFDIAWWAQLNYHKVILEVDSQLLVDWLMLKSTHPWIITSKMQKLHNLITHIPHFKCIHTLRETNIVVDSLSKHSP